MHSRRFLSFFPCIRFAKNLHCKSASAVRLGPYMAKSNISPVLSGVRYAYSEFSTEILSFYRNLSILFYKYSASKQLSDIINSFIFIIIFISLFSLKQSEPQYHFSYIFCYVSKIPYRRTQHPANRISSSAQYTSFCSLSRFSQSTSGLSTI